MPLSELIEKLCRAYKVAGLKCGDKLLPPANMDEIDELGRTLELKIPPELRELYSIHGGQEYFGAGTLGLFGKHRLHAPSEGIEHHSIYTECFDAPLLSLEDINTEENWAPQLIPFASWDKYDLCIDSVSGSVWEFSPNDGVLRVADSIEQVLKKLIVQIERGEEPDAVYKP